MSVLVANKNAIYVCIEKREDIDKIDRPISTQNEKVIVKTVEQDGVLVVFQYWISDRCDPEHAL